MGGATEEYDGGRGVRVQVFVRWLNKDELGEATALTKDHFLHSTLLT